MVELVVTEYRSLYDVKNARVVTYPWFDFTRRLEKPFVFKNMSWESYKDLPRELSQEQKNAGLWDLETRSKIKQLAGGAVYGRMVLPDGVTEAGRRAEYFPKRSAIVYDFEGCKEDIYDRISKALKDVTYAWHTTCSHRPQDGDIRLHVIIPFNMETDWRLYTIAAIDLAKKIGMEGLDRSCIKRSQMELYCVQLRGNEYRYQVHNIQEGNSVVFFNVENYLQKKYNTLDIRAIVKAMNIDVSEWCPELAKECKPEKTVVVEGKTIHYASKRDFRPKAAKRFDVVSCFNAAYSCWDILDGLVEYKRKGDRYQYYLGSGVSGVWVSDDGYWCGSFHADSGDPLHGHGNTAFDVWTKFYCDRRASFKVKKAEAHKYAKANNKRYYNLFYFGK